VLGAGALMLLATYTPILGDLLSTAPLGAAALGTAAAAAVLPGLLVRWVMSRES
jgi:hypothetical protein